MKNIFYLFKSIHTQRSINVFMFFKRWQYHKVRGCNRKYNARPISSKSGQRSTRSKPNSFIFNINGLGSSLSPSCFNSARRNFWGSKPISYRLPELGPPSFINIPLTLTSTLDSGVRLPFSAQNVTPFGPKLVLCHLSTINSGPLGAQPITKMNKENLKTGFNFRKKSSLKDLISESSFEAGDFWTDGLVDDRPSIFFFFFWIRNENFISNSKR